MNRWSILSILICVLFMLTACSSAESVPEGTTGVSQAQTSVVDDGVVDIELSDSEVLIEGQPADSDSSKAVYVSNDIVYYEEGKDFTYGEGSEADAHSAEEAKAHTVLHISKAGEYNLSGKLSKGQIAVDLGENAKKDKDAVVTLVLDGVDITCEVAPAVIFYNVYECSDADAETATNKVDTSAAGANVVIADNTENFVNGSYVARIYEPESVVLSSDGTEVEDASKLHKYDGAFYSKMSMNINGGEEAGVLNINAENEGLDSEMHLTINGGNINIVSGNDGINTNEDGVSVTTINGGVLDIRVTGETGEGDGIDSNGWLVINGGSVRAQACSFSADAGIDSDMGIHINGGEVLACGSMLDRIEDGGQAYATFNLREKLQGAGKKLVVKNSADEAVFEFGVQNDCSVILYSSSHLDKEENYNLYSGDTLIAESGDGFMGGPGGDMMPPDGNIPPQGEPPRWN